MTKRIHTGLRWGRSRWLPVLAASTALLTIGATRPTATPVRPEAVNLADITIQVPIIIPDSSVIIIPRDRIRLEREVTVRFVAQGDDWASIYLDGRRLFRANNTRRDYSITLEPGAYHLEITGVTQFDSWGSGYLDVGRNDANLIVVRYGKSTGIQVLGDPYVWFPED
jgi:hypothetical protein